MIFVLQRHSTTLLDLMDVIPEEKYYAFAEHNLYHLQNMIRIVEFTILDLIGIDKSEQKNWITPEFHYFEYPGVVYDEENKKKKKELQEKKNEENTNTQEKKSEDHELSSKIVETQPITENQIRLPLQIKNLIPPSTQKEIAKKTYKMVKKRLENIPNAAIKEKLTKEFSTKKELEADFEGWLNSFAIEALFLVLQIYYFLFNQLN